MNEGFKNLEKKKKMVAIIIIIFVIVGFLYFIVPDIQKSIALDPLEYANYHHGWGFNPPEGWIGGTVEPWGDSPSPYASFHPPEYNRYDVYLDIWGTPTGETQALEKLGQDRLDSFEDELWLNHTTNFSLISHGKTSINNMDAYEIVFYWEYSSEEGSNITKSMQKESYIVKGDTVVLVHYTALSNYYSLFDSDVENSLNSLTIVNSLFLI